jgi:hypothetical protein
VKYLIMVLSNPHFAERWEGLTAQQRADFGHRHRSLNDAVAESGELVAAEGLGDPVLARRVTARDGAVLVADGPFAEAKEHLAGFYLVDCATPERATEIAAQVPDAVWGLVEVRPVLDRSTVDL